MISFPSSNPSKRILVVEDDKPMRDVLEIALGNGGFQVVTAADGNEALELAKLIHFDLVITDMIMPGMEGIETIMKLRAMAPKIRIIAISGGPPGGTGDVLPLAQTLGVSAVLRKPFKRETFIAAVRECLSPTSV